MVWRGGWGVGWAESDDGVGGEFAVVLEFDFVADAFTFE